MSELKNFNKKELKIFDKKVLALSPLIDKHKVESYIAYRTGTNKNNDQRQAFMRLYKDKLTLALPMNEINSKDVERYSLKDNRSRYPRHELITKRLPFDSQCLEKCFLDLVKKSFKYIKNNE